MWKKWEDVTEVERKEIKRIAEQFQVMQRDVATMFQEGMSFAEIVVKLSRE